MAVPKPPANPEIDARVLARRQKDLDGFNEKYQEIIDQRAVKYAAEVAPTWKRIGRNVTDEIKAIYHELQDANGVPITEKPISAEKLRNMERNMQRLASLQAQLVKQMGTKEQAEKLKKNLAYSVAHAYYFEAFGMEQAARVSINVPILTHNQVMGIIANPWLPDGNTYSDRIRANTAYLAQKMKGAVEEAVGNGWGINRTARRIQEIAGEGYHNAVRLARTEINRAAAQGANHAYMQNSDILDGKRWNATLDKRTAPKDAANDGKIYELDYDTPESPGIAGERIPNHPNCRCKYSPVLSALGVSTRERIARGAGDTATGNFGERTYTKARTYREYAKERGLPDLDDRLRNDNPRRYLRRGETLADFVKEKTPATKKVVDQVTAAEGFKQLVEARIAKGVKTEADAVEVGDLVRQEIEKNIPPEARELADKVKALKDEQDKNYARYIEIKKMDVFKKQPYIEEMNTAARRWHELKNEIDSVQKSVAAAQGTAARDVISQIVPLGNPGKTAWAKGTHAAAREAYDSITNYLPTSWLEKSNAGREMVGRKVKRGHYWGGTSSKPAEFYVSGDTAAARAKVALHEMGHRMEHMIPEIKRLEYEFYQRRTAGEAKKTLPGYSSKEKGRLDDFLNPYMGKDYGNTESSFYEILSMGLEGVYMATTPIHTDKDYYNFILGVLVSIK